MSNFTLTDEEYETLAAVYLLGGTVHAVLSMLPSELKTTSELFPILSEVMRRAGRASSPLKPAP